MSRWTAFLISISFLWLPSPAAAETLKTDTVWSGEVSVTEDVLVPEGVALTILPGTVVRVSPSESTKTDPEYMSPLTEITIRGSLKAAGKVQGTVSFLMAGEGRAGGWAGIIVDGGTVTLRSCRIQDAETGIYVVKGTADIRDSALMKNRYGLLIQGGDASVHIENTKVRENDYGILLLNGAKLDRKNSVIQNNKKKDVYSPLAGNYKPLFMEYKPENKDKEGVKYRDEALLGTTVWKNRVEINGLVRIPEKSRLLIMPGTVIEFRKKAANKTGIGENGLLVQGVIIAKGTMEKPIVFRSAEKQNNRGDWDAINIMNSDGTQNLFEYCQIEDAYRGLHFHFSNVAVKNCVFRNNYRGVQFQESAVEISGSHFYGNKSGLQGRDSKIVFNNNNLHNNYTGAYIFRAQGIVKGNKIVNNFRDGLRLREGIPVVTENFVDGNRFGILVSDSVHGAFSGNVVSNNVETGVSLKGADNIEIAKNFIQGNGINGISIQESRAVIRGNHISRNGERGLGIRSFSGTITGNNIVGNGMFAIDLEGEMNISAPLNWWGGALIENVIYDRNDEPQRGRIEYKDPSREPLPFEWPLNAVLSDTVWEGVIHVRQAATVLPSATLKIMPNSRILFAKDSGLKVNGVLDAVGEKDARIVFNSLDKGEDAGWDEMLFEQSRGIFLNCDLERAATAIHSHFSNLRIHACNFKNNSVGIAFRGGPVDIAGSLFKGNTIGIKPFFGNALITGNVITGNETGVFVREEKSGGLSLRKNNIFGNNAYNIRLGDFNRGNVDAAENWWGDGSPNDGMFDEKNEPGIGKVLYEPFAQKPFAIDVSGRD